MLVRKKDNANASEKKILLTLVRKKIMYCIIKMMKLIRKIIISFRENKYNKNIKGLGGVSTAKISKAWVGSGLHFCQNYLVTFSNI